MLKCPVLFTSGSNKMIDIVAFLMENFANIQDFPSGNDLGYLLEHAGFDDDQIREAIICITLLNETEMQNETINQSSVWRIYHPEEESALPTEIRGLLHFLYESQTINTVQREFIIHALMHLPQDAITLDKAKVLALLILWAHQSELPVLIGDELMAVLHGRGIMH